tara:strand:- start:551 stop:700 length:150 start_codon:yes stop_codon:yes gene_type:complete
MKWIMNIVHDYFKCRKCVEYEERQKEFVFLVQDLIRTQNKILKYIDKSE